MLQFHMFVLTMNVNKMKKMNGLKKTCFCQPDWIQPIDMCTSDPLSASSAPCRSSYLLVSVDVVVFQKMCKS